MLTGLQRRPGGHGLRLLVLCLASIWDRTSVQTGLMRPAAATSYDAAVGILQTRPRGPSGAKSCTAPNWDFRSRSPDWQVHPSLATPGPAGRPTFGQSASKSGGQVCSSSANIQQPLHRPREGSHSGTHTTHARTEACQQGRLASPRQNGNQLQGLHDSRM